MAVKKLLSKKSLFQNPIDRDNGPSLADIERSFERFAEAATDMEHLITAWASQNIEKIEQAMVGLEADEQAQQRAKDYSKQFLMFPKIIYSSPPLSIKRRGMFCTLS